MLFKNLLLLCVISASATSAFAATDSKLSASWHDSRVVSKKQLRKLFVGAIKRADDFKAIAETREFSPEYRIETLTKSALEAREDFKLAAAFITGQDTSPTLKLHVAKLNALVADLPALVQPSTFSLAAEAAGKSSTELKTIASLLDLKI